MNKEFYGGFCLAGAPSPLSPSPEGKGKYLEEGPSPLSDTPLGEKVIYPQLGG